MVFILWGFFMVFLKPEKDRIPGLKEKATRMYKELGGMTRKEISASIIIFIAVVLIALKSLLPALDSVDKTGVLLFASAMSIGFCLWQPGAAKWLAVNWLVLFQNAPAIASILGMAFFVLVMTNFIMNVAAHRHQSAGGPGYCALARRRTSGYPFHRPGRRRHALLPPDRRGAQRHCLRLQAVRHR